MIFNDPVAPYNSNNTASPPPSSSQCSLFQATSSHPLKNSSLGQMLCHGSQQDNHYKQPRSSSYSAVFLSPECSVSVSHMCANTSS